MLDFLLDQNLFNISLIYWLLAIWLIWLLIEQRRLINLSGPMKRGVRIWEESLPSELEHPLRRLKKDIVLEHGFIRVEDQHILVRRPSPFLFNSWPYVGYINLTQDRPRIQFRASLPALLTLALAVVSVFMIPIVLAFFYINHRAERRAILDFLDEQVSHGVT